MKKLIFLLLASSWACNDILECDLNPNVEFAVIGFYNSIDSLEKTVAFKSVSVSNSPGKSAVDTAKYFAFNLDPSIESITYAFETDSDTYDLTLNYSINRVGIYSLDCEPFLQFDSLKASSTTFDSVAVVGPILNKNILLNVEIYF